MLRRGGSTAVVLHRSHEEETQWTQCIVDYFTTAGCGNLTATEIANYCGSPVNSNSTICPASFSECALIGAILASQPLAGDIETQGRYTAHHVGPCVRVLLI